jgi:hypothetical protein
MRLPNVEPWLVTWISPTSAYNCGGQVNHIVLPIKPFICSLDVHKLYRNCAPEGKTNYAKIGDVSAV